MGLIVTFSYMYIVCFDYVHHPQLLSLVSTSILLRFELSLKLVWQVQVLYYLSHTPALFSFITFQIGSRAGLGL
jgi:hypothetical protein